MTRLESTKKINMLKIRCINNGGYEKHRDLILKACNYHKESFGIDLAPNQLK